MPIGAANSLVNLNNMQPRFDRGYTGHEQMAGFGLINMNGRLYDPYLQRVLSPDNVVQDPLNAQSYNRYSYCLNNPLMYTDPTGWLAAGGYLQDLKDSHAYNGGSFYYRGGYMTKGYDGWAYFECGLNGWSQSLAPDRAAGGNGYHYDRTTRVYRDGNGDPVSFQSVYYCYIKPIISQKKTETVFEGKGHWKNDDKTGVVVDPYGNVFVFQEYTNDNATGKAGNFNIDNAISYLNAHANEGSVHACGRYVGLALQAGGIKGAMADGKDYGPILLKNGFDAVKTNGYSPIKGDVTVVDGNETHKWGHVQIYNGNQWVSDFFQGWCSTKPGYEYGGKGFMVYSKDIPSLTIYRIGN